jgi:hypothetical protein
MRFFSSTPVGELLQALRCSPIGWLTRGQGYDSTSAAETMWLGHNALSTHIFL